MDRSDTAIHEAGHAVIGIAYGLSVAYATIEPADFFRKETGLILTPIEIFVEVVGAMNVNNRVYRLPNNRDFFDVFSPMLSLMRDGKSIVNLKEDALALFAQIERGAGRQLKSIANNAKIQVAKYRESRVSTLGHVRVRATTTNLDRIIMMASGGEAVRHFNVAQPGVIIEAGDRHYDQMIADYLDRIYTASRAALRNDVEMSLRDEASRAVRLNSGFIEDVAYALEQRTRLDVVELEEILAQSSRSRNATLTRVRPARGGR